MIFSTCVGKDQRVRQDTGLARGREKAFSHSAAGRPDAFNHHRGLFNNSIIKTVPPATSLSQMYPMVRYSVTHLMWCLYKGTHSHRELANICKQP